MLKTVVKYYKILDGIQTQNIYLPCTTTKCDVTMAIMIAISSTRSRNIFTISARRKSIIRLMRTEEQNIRSIQDINKFI